jgi:hypothetical protein
MSVNNSIVDSKELKDNCSFADVFRGLSRILSSFRRDAAVTRVKERPGFQTSTPAACALQTSERLDRARRLQNFFGKLVSVRQTLS